MKSTRLILGILLVFAFEVNAEEDAFQKNCEKKWPHDFEMQLDCVNRQTDAALRLKELNDSLPHGGYDLMLAVNRCIKKWVKSRLDFDYVMALDCSERQIQAFEKLHGNPYAAIQNYCQKYGTRGDKSEKAIEICITRQEISFNYVRAVLSKNPRTDNCVKQHTDEDGMVNYLKVPDCIEK